MSAPDARSATRLARFVCSSTLRWNVDALLTSIFDNDPDNPAPARTPIARTVYRWLECERRTRPSEGPKRRCGLIDQDCSGPIAVCSAGEAVVASSRPKLLRNPTSFRDKLCSVWLTPGDDALF
jgi:hypothetical protein